MTALVTPIVNLNGTSREALVRQLMDVLSALYKAEQAICHAMPHGRDYQTHGTLCGAVTANAREAFAERARALHVMHGEFEALAIAINGQGRERTMADRTAEHKAAGFVPGQGTVATA